MTNTDTEATTVETVTPDTPENVTHEGTEGSNPFEDTPSSDVLALLDGAIVDSADTVETTEEVEEEIKEEENTEESAKFSKEFVRLSNKEKALAQREETLKAQSASLEKAEGAAKHYNEAPVDFIKAQLAHFTGSEDPDKVDAAFHNLYEAMTMHVLGADAPTEMKEQSQYNKLQRDFEDYKQQQQAEKTRLEEDALNSQRDVKVTQAQSKIKSQLSESKEQFPYLLNQSEEDPGELVFELVWQDYNARQQAGEENPTPMTIEEAASKANTHYQTIAQKWAKLVPSATTTTPPVTGQPATNRPGNSRTLTNSNASVAPTVEGSNYIDDDEESKQKAMELLFS